MITDFPQVSFCRVVSVYLFFIDVLSFFRILIRKQILFLVILYYRSSTCQIMSLMLVSVSVL